MKRASHSENIMFQPSRGTTPQRVFAKSRLLINLKLDNDMGLSRNCTRRKEKDIIRDQ